MRYIISIFVGFLILSLSNAYSKSPQYQEEVQKYKDLIEKNTNSGNKPEVAKNHNKLAFVYWGSGDLHSAASSFLKSAEINEELKNFGALRTIYSHLGSIYYELGSFNQAIANYKKSLDLNKKAGRTSEIISNQVNIANSYQENADYGESSRYANEALGKALEINEMKLVAECYEILAINAEKSGSSQDAKGYYDKYNTISKMLQKQEMEKMATQTKAYEKQVITKEQELKVTRDTLTTVVEKNKEILLQNELLSKEKQIQELQMAEQQAKDEAKKQAQMLIIVILAIFLLGALGIVIMVLRQVQQKKKTNKQLLENNQKIEQQKDEIEAQHDLAQKQKKRITDSIQYAQRIQRAVIPPEKLLDAYFEDHFVYYRPKDIVSGDFYWFTRKEHILVIAVADCTGHGVPGAFMSMLGVAYLNEIVNKLSANKHISEFYPDRILNELREMVITSLHQTGNPEEPKDGMDIALCVFDFENKKLHYAGANNPLFIIRNNELIEYKADRMPVSYHQKKDVPFTNHTIDLHENDTFYMTSDGFIDQFGGEKGLKFMVKRFKNILLENHTKPMEKQYEILNEKMVQWKGDKPQLDDMLVIGLRYEAHAIKEKEDTLKGKRILIAEDTDVNYILLAEVLRWTKAELVRVKNGQEAVDYVKDNPVNLVLMDINMPVMNGFEATKIIKKQKADLPVIIQTALHDGDEEKNSKDVGADAFISKPIDLKLFMATIKKFLN